MWPPRSLLITDRQRLGGQGQATLDRLVTFAQAAAEAGVDAMQLRERDLADGQLLDVTRRLCAAVRHTTCRVLVNERAHVAWAAGAHGVHLRSGGMPALRVRAVQPPSLVIGRSVHQDDAGVVLEGADYGLFGTVFPSGSKAPDAPVAGLPALTAWIRQTGGVPVLAVGGIVLSRCVAVRDAGAVGVAGIGLFAAAWASGAQALADVVGQIHAVFTDGERQE